MVATRGSRGLHREAPRDPWTRSRAAAILAALLLAASAVAVYAPVFDYPFVEYDDDRLLLASPAIRGGLSATSIGWAFTSVWEANWAPLTWISHMLDFSLHGNDAGGHHRTNVALHALNVLLLFAALRSATGATLRSALAAGLLALHPIHVESVAWISERKGLLSTAFGLGSYWAYLRFGRSGSLAARNLAVALLLLGLLCKAMLVSLPLLFLLADVWPLRRARFGSPAPGETAARLPLAALLVEKWPFFAVAALSALATFAAQSAGGAVRPLEALPAGERIGNALVAYVLYLWKLVWPAQLSVFYPHPSLPGGTFWSPFQIAGAVGLLAGLSLGVARAGRPALLAGWLWYLVALLPVSGLVQVGSLAMADRYAYLPAVGIYTGITWTLADLALRGGAVVRSAIAGLAGAALLAAGIAASRQVATWRSSESLFRHAIGATRANYSMHYNLAHVLKEQGRIEEAIAEYEEALAIYPDMARAHFQLANTLLGQNRIDAAIEHYRAAVETGPGFAAAWEALGNALIRKGDLPGALAHYRRNVELRPDLAESHVVLAHLLRIAGQLDAAVQEYEAAARLAPHDPRWREAADLVRAIQRGEAPPDVDAPP